nr:MAG TPA: hypothetical protein [Caudoviricetes sp.]
MFFHYLPPLTTSSIIARFGEKSMPIPAFRNRTGRNEYLRSSMVPIQGFRSRMCLRVD